MRLSLVQDRGQEPVNPVYREIWIRSRGSDHSNPFNRRTAVKY
jgi:hypothetical protein